jgi:hypothetical protein
VVVAASCILGALLALTLERNHVGVRSLEEFEVETGIQVLGLVPRIMRRRQRKFNLGGQPAHFREAMSAITARLWSNDLGDRGRVIMGTSAVPAEAKTWLAMSLGATFPKRAGEHCWWIATCTAARSAGCSGWMRCW